MSSFQCLRAVARPITMRTALRPSTAQLIQAQRPLIQSARSISLLAPRRPILPPNLSASTIPAPGSTAAPAIPSTGAPDLASKISSHPALGATQIRCGPRDTYNPSHFVRKRRHGFLSRIRTKKGRKVLMRRLKKGRWNLSH